MATILRMRSGFLDYTQVVRQVLVHGTIRSPRGMTTRDLGHVILEVEDPVHSLPLWCGRNVKVAIAAVEAAQLIGGFSDPDLVRRVSPNFEAFAEPDGTYWGAYGLRIGAQVSNVVRKLYEDPDTRQAVITLWHPALDNQWGKKDYPCTVAMNFVIINGKLEMRTLMRSNDVWLGFPYDLFQFTQLQMTVANVLDIPVGHYTHETWSLHLYERNVRAAEQLTGPRPNISAIPYHPYGFGRHGCAIEDAMTSAQLVVTPDFNWDHATPSERWYREQLAAYVGRDVDAGGTNDSTQIFMRP